MYVKTCAPAGVEATSWETIDFTVAEAYVKKLQMRIVKAQKMCIRDRLYCVLTDRKNKDPNAEVDVIARAEDASKISRIVERFNLASVDTASIVTEAEKSKDAKDGQPEPDIGCLLYTSWRPSDLEQRQGRIERQGNIDVYKRQYRNCPHYSQRGRSYHK